VKFSFWLAPSAKNNGRLGKRIDVHSWPSVAARRFDDSIVVVVLADM